ncbi:unnamed protein product, partial [Musa acuminata subsp. malaccensis]
LVGVRGPLGAGRAEVCLHHAGVEELDDGWKGDAAGHLVLVDGRAPRDGVVHELLEGAVPHHSYLQRADGAVRHPALPIHCVHGLLHLQAARLQRLLLRPLPPLPFPHQKLPVDDVVPRDGRRVRLARVLRHARPPRLQQLRRPLHRLLQLRLVRLVRLDAQQHVLPPHEPELRGRVVEAGDVEDVAHAVAVQPRVGGDHQLVLLPHLHVGQVHELRWRSGRRRVEGEELEVGHVRHDGVGDLAGLAHGAEVEAEVALGGGVHGARHRQAAAVVLEGGNVLRHGARHDHVEVHGVGPDPGDDTRPVPGGALRHDELREAGIGLEDLSHGVTDRGVGDLRAKGAGGDVVGELLPVELQETDGTEEAGGEDGADAEDGQAVEESAEHLGVHALEGVGAEDGGGGAGVDVVGVEGAGAEVLALVVTGENGAGGQAAGRLALRLNEQEVEPLALVQPGHSSSQVHNRHEKTVEELPPVQLFLDGGHQLPLAGRPIDRRPPGQELRYGVGGEYGGAVAVGDPMDLRLQVLVGDHRHLRLERLPVCRAAEIVPLHVLGLRVLAQDLRQHLLLHLVRVRGHLIYELQLLRVLLAGRRAQLGRGCRHHPHRP